MSGQFGHRLIDKVAVITQAGGSFGRVIAEAYVAEGARVVLQDWPERSTAIEALAEKLNRSSHGVARAVTADIARGAGASEVAASALALGGKIDILINTGMQGGHGVLFDIREHEWDACVSRGLSSYFFASQYIGEEMARSGSGVIINVTSIVADLGSGGAVPWCAVRGGVNSLTYALAQSLGEYGVRVVGLARGASESTPYTPEAKAERLRRLPIGRLGRESDLIGPAVFLATEEAGWITGSIVYCDGGYVHAAATDVEHRATERPLTRRGTKASPEPRPVGWIDQEAIGGHRL